MHEPDNKLGPKGAAALAPAFQQLTGLKQLALGCKCVIGSWPWVTACNDLHERYPTCYVVGVCIHISE